MPDGAKAANSTPSPSRPGPTIEDSRIGRLAYFADWLNAQQIRHCLAVQSAAAGRDEGPPKHFGQVAIEEGFLTRAQVEAILRIGLIDRASVTENTFGAVAVRLGFLTQEQLCACLAEQKRLLHERGKAPLLGLMLTEKSVLTSEQVKAVLGEQSRAGEGALHQLEEAETEATRDDEVSGDTVCDPESGDRVVCRCEACGATSTVRSWLEGMPCPECGGGPFAPAPIVDLAVGYSLADRRFGPASEDNRLGMMAYFAGWMTLEQVRYCLREQADTIEREGRPVKFGEVALGKRMLSEQRISALLHMQAIRRPSKDEQTFGAIAVRKGFTTQQQLDECLEEQWRCLVENQEAPRIGLLMVEKGFITQQQVKAILQFQARYGQGPLADEEDIEEEPRVALWRTLVANARLALIVPIVIIVLSLSAITTDWFGGVGWRPAEIAAGCGRCQHVFVVSGTTEIACPSCKAIRTVCPLVRCEKCQAVFLFGQLGQGRRCPKCGGKILAPLHDEDEAKAAWRASREK